MKNQIKRVLGSRFVLNRVMRGLHGAGRGGWRLPRRLGPVRRVVHISPCYFSDRSYVGGGERYATCLAQAMAEKVETVLVTFGPERRRITQGRLRIEVYPVLKLIQGVAYDPLCYQFLREIGRADVIHCHQFRTAVTNLAIAAGAAMRKRVFVTDLGAGGCHFTHILPLNESVDGFLPISAFGERMTAADGPTKIIYGGVEQKFLEPVASPRTAPGSVLFTGRLLPHKGINYLIEAMDADVPLLINGRPYDERYLQMLQGLAEGKNVLFRTDATDDDLIEAYRSATVTVLPSVYKDIYGAEYEAPELLGLVLLESMACGTPVICTDVGAMPEFVEDGVTGFVVPPNNPAALKEKINWLIKNPEAAAEMGRRGRQEVLTKYTWEAVADRCLASYRSQREH